MLFCCKNHRNSHWRYSVREAVHKKLRQFQRKTPVLECLFNNVAALRAYSFITKRLQHGCFPVRLAKFLRTSILKNICERLLLKFSTLQKKLFTDFFHKIMTYIIITKTFEPLKFLLSFCVVFANFFMKIFIPPFFVNFLLLN